MRSRPLRLALGVVGLALAVYGVAGLTGGWLGTPPWWEPPKSPVRQFEPTMAPLDINADPPTPSDRWVVVVHGLTIEEATEEVGILFGLEAEFSFGFMIDIAIKRKHAHEAYLRIANSKYRDRGLLVKWDSGFGPPK